MFLGKPAHIDNLLKEAFLLYKTDILKLHNKVWKDEDYEGESCNQFVLYQYYLAIYFVVLIWLYVQQNPNKTWVEIEEHFDINNKRKQLACNNIDLDKILNIFSLPLKGTCHGGIENMGFEHCFIIEPSSVCQVTPNTEVVDMLAILNNMNHCVNHINNC